MSEKSPLENPKVWSDHIEELKGESDIDQMIQEALITSFDLIEEPPVCLILEGSVIANLGDFSLIIGKAKSRKSFSIALVVAALISTQNGNYAF